MVWVLSYTLLDAENHKSVAGMYLPDATAQVDAVGFAEDMAAIIDNITECRIDRLALSLLVPLPVGLKANPVPTSEVEIGARFGFADAQSFRTSVRIPGFPQAKLVQGSNTVDLTDVDVLAFTNAMRDGLQPGAILVEPATNRGDDIVALVSAVESFTKARK